MSSLQRSGPGLWFSSCGRFAVRRLPTGHWAISSVGSPARVGGFTSRVSSQIITQRFTSLADARTAIDLLLEMELPVDSCPGMEWQSQEEDWVYVSPQGMDVIISPEGNFWNITALPASLRSRAGASLGSQFMADRARFFLGRARTLAGAKEIVGQELTEPWPELPDLFA